MFCLITYLLPPGVAAPTAAAKLSASYPFPFLVGWPTWIGHPDPDFKVVPPQHSQQPCSRSTSRRKAPCHGFHDSKAVDQPSTASHDLAGHLDRRRTERRELHPQQRSFLGWCWPHAGAIPVSSRHSKPSGSRPNWPSPYRPSCSPVVDASSALCSRRFEVGDQVLLVADRWPRHISSAGVTRSLAQRKK